MGNVGKDASTVRQEQEIGGSGKRGGDLENVGVGEDKYKKVL